MCVNWDYILPGDAYANVLALPVWRKSLQQPPENSHCSITHWKDFQEISIYFLCAGPKRVVWGSGWGHLNTCAGQSRYIFTHPDQTHKWSDSDIYIFFFLPLYRMISTHNNRSNIVLCVWNAILAPSLSLASLIHCIMRKPYWEELFKECNMDNPNTWVVHGQIPVPD